MSIIFKIRILIHNKFNPKFYFMKISFEKKLWFEASAILLRKYKNLSETDFQFKEGGEYRMMERIRTKVQLSKIEFYEMLGLRQGTARITSSIASIEPLRA